MKKTRLLPVFLVLISMVLPVILQAASAKFHVDVGLNHFYKKRFLEAYREFKKALEVDERYPDAHYNLGRVYQAQGFIKEALVEYQIALKLKPDYIAARRAYDSLKASLEDDVRQQLKIKGKDNIDKTVFKPLPAEQAEKKGRELLSQNRPQEAIRYFEQAVRQRPDNLGLNKILGYLYFRQNRFANALKYYEKALELMPVDPEIPYAIGLIQMKTSLPEKAESYFRKAVALRPEMVKAVFALGEALEAQNKIEDAIFQFRKCLKLNPQLTEAEDKLNYLVAQMSYNYFSRGSYFYQRGDYEKAESMLSLAKNYGNLSPEQSQQVSEMLDASRYWLNKQREKRKVIDAREQVRNSSYINQDISVYDVSQNPKPYIDEAVIWSGRVEFVGERDGQRYLFVNSRPEINLDDGMENAFEIVFPEPLPNDPRIALGSEVVEVNGKILRVEKIRDKITGAFSFRRQPIVEATEIEIKRKNYEQPLILRFY